ncbi:MAG: HPr family phosphocarrier protein [Synergistaceae bacterium]|jgi:phosphocarrier protein|nr:HPr family phosphocarrier protein [Synergistaceae bacterium]
MYSKKISVKNPTGLHARPASDFVAAAAEYKSSVTLKRAGEDDEYNAKSIVMLLALGLEQGEEAILTAEGDDETEAVEVLASLVERFAE